MIPEGNWRDLFGVVGTCWDLLGLTRLNQIVRAQVAGPEFFTIEAI
jgi:hypothetical protein